MSYLQDTSGPKELGSCTDIPTLPGQFGGHLNLDAKEQFIPKPRDQSRSSQHSDAERKTVNKRRPFITRVFHRALVPHQDQVSPSLPITKRGKLFGNDLTVVCDDGNLPKAILDMLSLLNEKGPVTEGIFRISANLSACQALKEKLDAGKKVNLKKECVLVVASVLKEFLHNIQGSVLTSRLHDMWLGVLDQGNEEEKLAAVQSLLEQLPYPNVILLKKLFTMLYNIGRHSSVNQMTAYSLSVCMAPCILCLPSSCNSGLATDISKEISLVKFLIENSLKIFGEDMVLCYYESSVSCPDVEKAPCSLNNITCVAETKDKEYQDNHSRSGRTCPTGNDSEPMRPAALLHNEEPIDSEKPVKRSFIKPIITCGSSTSHDNVCITPSPEVSNNGRLFGKSLTSLCRDGNLPAPILEFIRNIQGSLLCSNLYGKWLDVPDQESHDQKISAIQSLLIQMPEPNVLLLRHLLSVLHRIKGCSSINHMDANALSVLIAPNMLWNPTPSSSAFGNDLSKKISIVELLIESFLEIFGEDATVFYGEIPKSRSDIEKDLGSLNDVPESNKVRNPRGDNRGSCHSEKTHPQQNDEESLSASP